MNGEKIIFAVFDTLHHEYRGYKVALSFVKSGYDVSVIGIKYCNDELKGWEGICTYRIRVFRKLPLPLNMIIFWLRLFFLLLERKCSVIYSHDIFPLMPVYLASRLKRVHYIYDAHEFWHGNSQTENRPFVRFFWISFERIFIKAAKRVITVSGPIAEELERIYKIDQVGVFTNLPLKKEIPTDRKLLHRITGIPEEKKIVLYQGHFLINNGLETVLEAFTKVKNEAVLVLIGSGSEKDKLDRTASDLGIGHRVWITGPFPHDELIRYTICADIGLCLIRNCGKSYYFSAPNKMFEFIQAQVPQIASDFPEISRYVKGYGTGEVTDPSNADLIAEKINDLLENRNRYDIMRKNCSKAADHLVWEKIESDLLDFLK